MDCRCAWTRALPPFLGGGFPLVCSHRSVVRDDVAMFRAQVCGTDFIDEVLTLEDGGGAKEDLRYRQAVGSFSNPNGHVNVHSLNWLRSCCAELGASKATGADDSSEPGPSLLEL